jgi:hypothetical protein
MPQRLAYGFHVCAGRCHCKQNRRNGNSDPHVISRPGDDGDAKPAHEEASQAFQAEGGGVAEILIVRGSDAGLLRRACHEIVHYVRTGEALKPSNQSAASDLQQGQLAPRREHRRVTDTNLVFDIGANTGQDTAALLARGLHVVAVEATPKLCADLRVRFADEISNGRLVIIDKAISGRKTVTLYVNAADSGWGTTSAGANRVEHAGSSS